MSHLNAPPPGLARLARGLSMCPWYATESGWHWNGPGGVRASLFAPALEGDPRALVLDAATLRARAGIAGAPPDGPWADTALAPRVAGTPPEVPACVPVWAWRRLDALRCADPTRYVLAGIRVAPDLAEATDGHRLERIRGTWGGPPVAAGRGVVAAEACDVVDALCPRDAETVRVWPGVLEATAPGAILRVSWPPVDARFPDTAQVIPTGGAEVVLAGADLRTLRRAVRDAAAAAAGPQRMVRLTLTDTGARVDLPGGALPSGPGAWLNGRYLTDALWTPPGAPPRVTLAIRSGQDPLRVERADATHVLMPCRGPT